MTQKSNLSSPSLQKIQLESEPIIAQHLQKIHDVSNDIKALEDQFKNSAIHFTLIHVLSSSKKMYDEADGYQESFRRTDILEYEDICLVWCKTNEGNYRLSKNIYITKIEVHLDYSSGDVLDIFEQYPSQLTFSKPLIETKSHFRLQIEKELSPFYKNIIQILKIGRYDETEISFSEHYNSNMDYATSRLKNQRINYLKKIDEIKKLTDDLNKLDELIPW